MITLPINATNFEKSFLNGNGTLKIQTDQDVWQTLVNGNKEFTPEVDSLAEVKVDLSANSQLKFGQPENNQLKLDLDVSTENVGAIRLIWKSDDEIIKKYKFENLLTANHYFALLSFKSIADASIKGNASLFGGPLKATFGIGGGGNVGYERLIRFPKNEKASEVISQIFKGTRLPQSVKDVNSIPKEGEVLSFNYGGYLNLNAGLTWGYSLAGTRNIEISNLKLSLDYALRLMAAASFSYRIAGDFEIEARRGQNPNWVNIAVRKSKESNSKFAFDFGFNAKYSLSPADILKSPEKLIEALLEIDTDSFMKVLDEIRGVSTVEGIKAKLNDLAEDFVVSKAIKWLGNALDSSNINSFLQIVNNIVETYKNIDQKIIHLYEDFIDDLDGLNGMLDALIDLPNRLGLGRFNNAADKAIWDLIRRLAGDKFYQVILDDQEFSQFSDFVKEIKKFVTDGVNKHIRDFIKDLKAEFKLDAIFNQIGEFDTVPKIKNLADKKLKALIEKIVGEAIDNNSQVLDKILKPLQSFFKNLDKFNEVYAKAVEKAINQSFAFNLNYAYNTLKKGESLLEVEIDLSNAKGKALAQKAFNGDFNDLLQSFDPTLVRLNKAVFKAELTKSAELKINIFNYNQRGFVRLVQQSEHSVEALANGLLHLYSIDTNQETLDEKGWRKNKENVKTNFALKIVGSSLQPTGSVINPDTVQNLKQISAQYSASYEDSQTQIRELRQYLGLAGLLNLVSPNEVINTLISKLGKNGEKDIIGKVKLEYVAKYSDEAVRQAFTSSAPADFELMLRQVIREITAAPFMSKPINNGQCLIRLAYQSPEVFQHYRNNSNSLGGLTLNVKAPVWHRSFPAQAQLNDSMRQILEFFYRREDSILKRFPKLFHVLQNFPNVDLDDLQAEARNFVSLSNDLLINNADNPFFALFDWLIRTKSSVPNQRQSALIITLETNLNDGTPFETTLFFTS